MLPASVELKGNLLEEPANIVSPALQVWLLFFFIFFCPSHIEIYLRKQNSGVGIRAAISVICQGICSLSGFPGGPTGKEPDCQCTRCKSLPGLDL